MTPQQTTGGPLRVTRTKYTEFSEYLPHLLHHVIHENGKMVLGQSRSVFVEFTTELARDSILIRSTLLVTSALSLLAESPYYYLEPPQASLCGSCQNAVMQLASASPPPRFDQKWRTKTCDKTSLLTSI